MRRAIAEAVRVLRAGGLVAFPTETVYGLGADARRPAAVARIFAAKGRPADHPLIVHVADQAEARRWARAWPEPAHRLAEAFWPGPLTLIVDKAQDVPDEVTGGQPTVGLRVPDHPLALELLRAFGGGVAAPSANRFGSVSPTTAAHVALELGDSVDLILDGGPCRVGVESSIVDLSRATRRAVAKGADADADGTDRSSERAPRLLRPGGLPRERIEAVLGAPLSTGPGRTRAPGTLPSHYAPRARVLAVSAEALDEQVERVASAGEGPVVVLGPRAVPGAAHLPLPADPEGAARALYSALREVDARRFAVAVVPLPEERGLGAAVADRLRRASAPRPGPDGT
ncbi:MAG TPA: L-threonylcarbamoyladenylate synthase [Sandaracinaceae bacterium LLY-WYZ-13_1]|nr:L-threonylcarbamoyladenylate synthase [Sandaracinaceae bacterium LLY-WYZ-13_1]